MQIACVMEKLTATDLGDKFSGDTFSGDPLSGDPAIFLQ